MICIATCAPVRAISLLSCPMSYRMSSLVSLCTSPRASKAAPHTQQTFMSRRCHRVRFSHCKAFLLPTLVLLSEMPTRRLRLRLGSGFRPPGRASLRDCPRPYTAIGSATSCPSRVSFVCAALVFVLLWPLFTWQASTSGKTSLPTRTSCPVR